MKYKIPVAILLIFLILGALFGLLSYTKFQKEEKEELLSQVADGKFGWKFPTVGFPDAGSGDSTLLAFSSLRDPGGISQGLPVRLTIPAIGVNTAIEDALITHDGRMDVPAGSINVAWFALGPYPGRVGSAVIGGHYGIDNGVPKVFYNLDKLQIGDIVNVIDDRGKTLSFIVRSKKSFNRDDDATTVFTSQDGLAHLNIITCEGVWNQVNDTYPQRLVVFTDAIPSQQAAVTSPTFPATASTSPSPKPRPTPTPPPTTTPSPKSTSRPTTEPSPSVESSPIPDPVIVDQEFDQPSKPTTPTFIQNLASNSQILFGHPLDIGITSLLLGSITLVVFKIIKG